jgi:hypothetical protein
MSERTADVETHARKARQDQQLRQVLRSHSSALAEHLAEHLTGGLGPDSRYADLAPDVLLERCRLFVDALVRATGSDPESLADYVGGVARRRLAEGFGLHELQRAVRILEVEVWRLVVADSAPEDLASNLCGLSVAFGQARDELARASESHAWTTARHGSKPSRG